MSTHKVTVNCEHCNESSSTHAVTGSQDTPENAAKLQADAVIEHRNSLSHMLNTRGNIFSGSSFLTIKPKNSEFKHGKDHNN